MPTVGTAKCLACSETIPVKVNANGAQNWSCPWCDFSGYAKKGTQAQTKLAPRLTLAAIEKAPEEKLGAKPAEPASAEKKTKAKMPWER